MSRFCQNFLVVLIISSSIQAKLLVDDECAGNRLSCPEKSKCRPLSCRGYRCACDEGYMPVDNNTKCIKGTALGQNCGPTYPPCLNANAICLKDLISLSPPYCQCEKGYIKAGNLQCLVQTDYKRFGDWCENKCGPTLTCKLGFCQCRPGYRQRTAIEIQADPAYQHDCIENEFSLTKCRGTEVLLLAGINTNSFSNEIQKSSTEFNENYTDTMPTIDHSRELETWTTQYNLTTSNPDNQSSDITMPTSTETPTLSTPISLKVISTSTASPVKIQTTTMATTLEITTSPSESSPSSDNQPITDLLASKSTLTTQAAIKTTKLKEFLTAIPDNHDTTTNRIRKITLPTKAQNSDSSSQTYRTRLSVKTQVPTTIINMITSSDQTSQSTERVSLSKVNTILIQVPTSSPTTTGPTTDSQSQKTMKTTHWGLSSVAIENGTSLPTIPRQSKNSTIKKLPTATNASTAHVLQISEVTTDTAVQNITATPVNESNLTHTPATQTDAQPQPNSENRISTEAIVIPSVLVIVLTIIIISIIAVIVCRKRRSHLSLSTGVDNNTYKLPRPSMMSEALTSAPSPPTSYGTGRHPSYHYVNYAFENENF